jgi:hypothetical protein
VEGEPYFRFEIELSPEVNPRGVIDELQEGLRGWLTARDLSYVFGNFGGMRLCYGEVGPPATEDHRQAMAEWLAAQRVCGTVRLEALVPFDPSADIRAPITDWIFAVDNLTETERAEAVAYHAEMRRWAQSKAAPDQSRGG